MTKRREGGRRLILRDSTLSLLSSYTNAEILLAIGDSKLTNAVPAVSANLGLILRCGHRSRRCGRHRNRRRRHGN
jgi:hypothetical protein